MSDIQSIEDLTSASSGSEESSRSKFEKKQGEIKLKAIERAVKQKAAGAGISYIDLVGFPISPEALQLVSREDSARLETICFYFDGSKINLGTTDAANQEARDLLASLCEQNHTEGEMFFISDHSFKYAIDFYNRLPKIRKFVSGVEIKAADLERFKKEIKTYRDLQEKINEISISDTVTFILATALKTESSDIHIEAEEHGIVVRFRIDGVLQEAAVIDRDKWKKIISRMKLLAKVKINIADKPQDGRYAIFLPDNSKVDVRCSFLPTAFGESVVMRLLVSSSIQLSFNDLGLRKTQYEILNREIGKPNGMVLVTGPTGSGKTTTMYAALNKLNAPDTKIITLEDPIEYELKGINQSQVNPGKDYTFANGLRSILRQDPDIIMIGEMRDLETAEIAVQASLTGHLVLSTLHTNDAAGVIPRLIDMGVKPFFLAPSINCLVGQRLIRKLCPHCRIEHQLTKEEETQVKKILAVISPRAGLDIPSVLPKIYHAGAGCDYCHGIGYKGRIGIYEMLTLDNSIKELITGQAAEFKILERAIENGMVTMLQDGILKCLDGITDLAEVYRVIGKFEYVDALYDIIISKVIGRGIAVSQEKMAEAETLARQPDEIGSAIEHILTNDLMVLVMAIALKMEAGDVHIDPGESGARIRFRIDGILHDIALISNEHYIPVLTQIKNLAGFPLNVKKATYDGRFAVMVENQPKIDCRISIISGGYGETVVIRILSSQAAQLKMEDLGIRSISLNLLNKAITKTRGVIVNTGPTGSGKTTTLYSILNQLNRPDIKIITIEDPIEYHLEGIMQTQISDEQGYTFAAALRSLMRQNPNIIMIGEVRDQETAKVAIEAAQTGHLVLTTVHANSAAGAISRFAGLGVDRQSLMSALECSIGQRLVRRLCVHCREEEELEPEILAEVKKILDQISPVAGVKIPAELKFYRGRGCDQCSQIGYKGRVGIYEVISLDADLQAIIQSPDARDFDIEKEAMAKGTILMLQDGLLKALSGETSVEEVFRVAR